VSHSYRAGLVILALLSRVDVAGPLLTDGETPPMAIALVGCALGVASLVCVVLAWRGMTRAVLPLVVLRLLSALSAVPAFFVSDVPPAIRGLASALVLLTVGGVALVVGSRERKMVTA